MIYLSGIFFSVPHFRSVNLIPQQDQLLCITRYYLFLLQIPAGGVEEGTWKRSGWEDTFWNTVYKVVVQRETVV